MHPPGITSTVLMAVGVALLAVGLLWRRASGAAPHTAPHVRGEHRKWVGVVAIGIVLLAFGILIALAKLGPGALALLGLVWLFMVVVALTAGRRRRGPATTNWQRFVDLCRLVDFLSP